MELCMRVPWLVVVWLVLSTLAAAQDAPKAHVRFFNDSAKYVNFYLDGKFGCFIPENPKESNAWCDADASTGKHRVSVKGIKLRDQSCELYVTYRGFGEPGAEAHLSKGELLHCMSFATD
jgi:hypothetical protein